MRKVRWLNLMNAIGLPNSLDICESLLKAYAEKHRHYHTSEHINAMLGHFHQSKDLAEHPHEVELAIWFHDAIYKPFSSSNEQDSANWAKAFLLENNYQPDGVERIYQLIMATIHPCDVTNKDQQLIVDIDLTILGTPANVYNKFEQNIRKEYRLVPTFIYRKKRKQLLQGFLEMEFIYNLKYFRLKYEQIARDNIGRAIKRL